MRKVIPFILILLFLTNPLWAADTHTVTTCTHENVQTAITAASAGDSVYLNCATQSGTWDSAVTVPIGITIYGNGQDSTVLTSTGSCLFSITLGTGAVFRIHDIGVAGTGGSCGGLETQFIRISGDGTNMWTSLRADHMKFTNTDTHAFTIDPWWNITSNPKALFDNISFSSNVWSRFLKIAGNNSSWRSPDNYGTDDAVYIENSVFTWTSNANGDIMDTEHGVRMVVRHNTITGGDIQMHDTGSTPAARGQRITEIYGNTIDSTGSTQSYAMGLRGGGYIVYNNTITNYSSGPAFPQIYRSAAGAGYLGGYCNGTALRACNTATYYHCDNSPYTTCTYVGDSICGVGSCVVACTNNNQCPTGTDGTSTCLASVDNVNEGSDAYGWPCRDQTGWGQEYGTGGRYQYPSPVYWWNNGTDSTCSSGGNCPNTVSPSDVTNYFVQNRDYCLHNTSTDCGAKTAWTYTPYTYPHPLRGEAEASKLTFSGASISGGSIR